MHRAEGTKIRSENGQLAVAVCRSLETLEEKFSGAMRPKAKQQREIRE